MFRTLIYPSSGACDCVVELPHVCMYICMFMYICMYICLCMCVHVCMYVHMHVYMCMYVYVCTYACIYVYVCVCMYVCVCIYLFIIILHAPLLWSNTRCIGGFLHNYIISTKIPCSIYKFVKLTIIVYNLSKGIFFVIFF